MSTLTLFTSGSTKDPKEVVHPWDHIKQCASRSIQEIGLRSDDRVLNIFPSNVIAHYTITVLPALTAGAHLYTANFEPYSYIKMFNDFRPTFISLIPRHYEILKQTKNWNDLDMSCVRYMVTGSSSISQDMIDAFRNKGVQTVANWYGMTEMPPPVFVGYNTASFDFATKEGYSVEFTDEGECVINGFATGDIFDTTTRTFLRRKTNATNSTWKN